MASFMDKFKMTTAVEDMTKLDLSCQHITTSNFMQYDVAKSIEMVPHQKIEIFQETFARLAPMPVPTFGRANIHNRAFFVPYRTIFPAWNDFITDTVHVYGDGTSGLVNSVPTISNDQLLSVFLSSTMSKEMANSDPNLSGDNYDFVYIETASDYEYRNFTLAGRKAYKLLVSLGYRIDFNAQSPNVTMSALPLLAAAKIYMDWYYPSAYSADSRASSIEKWLKYDKKDFATAFTTQDLDELLKFLSVVNYDSDYFVSAWDNPVNPNQGSYSDIVVTDITNGTNTSGRKVVVAQGGSATGSKNAPILGTGTISGNNTAFGTTVAATVSQYMLDALRAVTDYMKRHQMVGARALDRYLAQWGINLPAEKLNRSIYLGCNKQTIQFGDVTSTAETSTANLGDYAGKGISFGDGKIEFSTTEFGMLIIISSIVPVTGYYQGQDRTTMHIGKLDFYNPEFDNLGVQAIGIRELYVPENSLTAQENKAVSDGTMVGLDWNSYTFGFTPRYAEYKVARDQITGDYIRGSVNTGGSSWTLYRDMKPQMNGVDNISYLKHDFDFVRGSDAGQYNRIFYNTNNDVDHFNIIHNFNIISTSPMKSLFDTYEFKNDDKGKKVIEDVNGVKMN